MRPSAIALVALIAALVALIASGVAFFSVNAGSADQGKGAELLARIQQLENRVADQGKDADLLTRNRQLEKRVVELEQAIKEIRASPKEAPRTETEKKLVGTWVVSDADKKAAWYTDMKLQGDGTCDLVDRESKALSNTTYQVIGQHIVFTQKFGMGSLSWEGRLASITDAELVIEARDGSRKFHYTRSK
jgi:hypothetical protein